MLRHLPTLRSARGSSPTPHLTGRGPAGPGASPAAPSPSPTALPPFLPALQVGEQLPCGFGFPDRTARSPLGRCPAGGLIPRQEWVAGRTTGPAARPQRQAFASPVLPSPSVWQWFCGLVTPSGGPRHTASSPPSPSARRTSPCGRGRGKWLGRRPRRRGGRVVDDTRPTPSGRAVEQGRRKP